MSNPNEEKGIPCEMCHQPTEDKFRMMAICRSCKPKVQANREKNRINLGLQPK